MLADTVEAIHIGQLTVQYLLEGEASGGSVAIFELTVPNWGEGAGCPQPRCI